MEHIFKVKGSLSKVWRLDNTDIDMAVDNVEFDIVVESGLDRQDVGVELYGTTWRVGEPQGGIQVKLSNKDEIYSHECSLLRTVCLCKSHNGYGDFVFIDKVLN